MNYTTLLLLSLLLVAIPSIAQERDRGAEEEPPPNEAGTYEVAKRLTLPSCIEFHWKVADNDKLPTSIRLKNPFLEKLWVGATVHGDPCADFEIEYYDSHLNGWRRRVGLVGTRGGESILIKPGESVVLPIDEDFWTFIRESISDFKLQEPVRIRLAFDLGEVTLQSPEFQWDRANKSVVDNRLPDLNQSSPGKDNAQPESDGRSR